MRYGFIGLLNDVAWWLTLGIVLSAVVEAAIPADLFEGTWGGGLTSMLLMLVLSILLYTCASSSTPMACTRRPLAAFSRVHSPLVVFL